AAAGVSRRARPGAPASRTAQRSHLVRYGSRSAVLAAIHPSARPRPARAVSGVSILALERHAAVPVRREEKAAPLRVRRARRAAAPALASALVATASRHLPRPAPHTDRSERAPVLRGASRKWRPCLRAGQCR